MQAQLPQVRMPGGLASEPARERCIGSWQAAVRPLDSLPAARPA